jgi:methylmalonyl-CoA mutase
MEATATTAPMPPVEAGPLPAWRMAEPIERIRQRTEAHAAKAGRAPVVLLLTRGDLKMRMARANFTRNFLGCAGFTIVESGELAAGDGAAPDLVVLCSSDAEYLALAHDVVPQVQAPVIVAGHPAEQIEALRAAGVAGFVHMGSDIVATLTEWQDRLGLEAVR